MRGFSRKLARPAPRSQGVALLVVDNVSLQRLAWERLQAARRRLTKASAELHRHEQKDEPAYRGWMAATCPALLSEIRELMLQLQSKSALISYVEEQARRRGKTPAMIWQLYKNQMPSAEDLSHRVGETPDRDDEMTEDEVEQALDEWLRDQGVDPFSAEAEQMRDVRRAYYRAPEPEESGDAKEIYRRLVQQLHPDRGGEWSSQREAVWHEVQRAWKDRDADWLARLEAELEMAAETLSVASAVGRLYAALAEIDPARRDTESKLRRYRQTPAWRFTLKTPSPNDVKELTFSLGDERDNLRRHLEQLESTFARWEKPLGQARARQRDTGEGETPDATRPLLEAGSIEE